MKRKLISQRDSLTLTLPKEWTTAQNLKAGDEIDLGISEESLILNNYKKEEKREYTLDISNLSDECIRNVLNSLYILSATKIIIRANKESKLLLCKKLTSLFLVGFEISEERKDEVVLEALAVPSQDNFDKFFSKFWNFLEFDLEALTKMKEDKDIDYNEEIKRDTKKVTQYSNICKRILLNNLIKNTEKSVLLEVISYLEEVNHLIFHVFQDNIKITRIEAEVVKEIFFSIRKGYFKKDIAELNHAQEKILKSKKDIQKSPYLFAIIRNLYGLSNIILELALPIQKQQ